jgi:energy-converting hydrogenase Eha subunit B
VSTPGPPDSPDPVAAKRESIGKAVVVAKRIGYLALLVAVIGFVLCALSGFESWAVGLTITSLVVAIVVLPLPIIVGYGIRAAEREERGERGFH